QHGSNFPTVFRRNHVFTKNAMFKFTKETVVPLLSMSESSDRYSHYNDAANYPAAGGAGTPAPPGGSPGRGTSSPSRVWHSHRHHCCERPHSSTSRPQSRQRQIQPI